MYFAALNGAAELSTGLLVQMHLQGYGNWSMLVTSFQASFLKKATGKIRFECNDGVALADLIEKLNVLKEAGEITISSNAYNEDNMLVAEFKLGWSLKKKE
jgi:hypothetical protein